MALSEMATGEIIIRDPGAGLKLPGPEGITVKATGAETGGSIGFIEATSPPGFGPPRHIHHSHDELFYVIAGNLIFLVGEQLFEAEAGSFVFIPRGTVHAPRVVGDSPATIISAFVPGGAELAFEEFARLAPDLASQPEQVAAIARKYDSEFVGPPL